MKNTRAQSPDSPASPEVPFFSIIQRIGIGGIGGVARSRGCPGWRPVVIGGVKMAARPESWGSSVRMNVQATTEREARFILKQITQAARALRKGSPARTIRPARR